MGKFVFALAFSLSTFLLGGDAWAAPQWCEEDPVFVVNGAIIDVTTQFPAQHASSVKAVHFELIVPSNAIAAVVALPGKVPSTAKITRSLPADRWLLVVPVILKVTVPAKASFETRTRVVGTHKWLAQYVYGRSNESTQVKYFLLGL